MEQKFFYGDVTPEDFSRSLYAHFHRGNYQVQQIGRDQKILVQIASTRYTTSGGRTALTVNLEKVEDGVLVQLGQQAWLGIAASLGRSALSALKNPLSLIGNLDDIAQDFESLGLSDEIWTVIESTARAKNAGQQLSERLRRITCGYCGSANPIGESRCIACGAPLGDEQPVTCPKCGYVLSEGEKICPNCGHVR